MVRTNKSKVILSVFSLFVVLVLFLFILPQSKVEAASGYWVNFAAATYDGGDGTVDNPYLIATEEQFAYFGNMVTDGNKYAGTYFKLTKDLDLSEHYWIPIGQGQPFSGDFNGNNHTISNVNSNLAFSQAGLFGRNYGKIHNLGVLNVTIFSIYTKIGGFVGSSYGEISNCFVNGGTVTGNMEVGGFIGDNNGIISNCYANADVYGTGSSMFAFGGFAGSNDGFVSGTPIIFNCFSTGTVQNNPTTGGFVGYANKGSNANCIITNVFYTENIGTNGIGSGYNSEYITEQVSLSQLTTESFYNEQLPSWDFNEVWKITQGENNGLPYLINETPSYTVTFSVDGVTAEQSTLQEGALVTKPQDPQKAHYRFTGWYCEETCLTLWNFDSNTVTANLTLYAGWEADKHYVNVEKFGNGSVLFDNDLNWAAGGGKVYFHVIPDTGYKIEKALLNDVVIIENTDTLYFATPALYEDAQLTVYFTERDPILPLIKTSTIAEQYHFLYPAVTSGGESVNLNIPKAYFNYGSFSNPDNFEISDYGVILTDVEAAKQIKLQGHYLSNDNEFCILIFGEGLESGKTYKAQNYVTYSNQGNDETVLSEENLFIA